MAEIQNVRPAKFRSFPFTSHVRAKCYDARYITVHIICDVHRSVYYSVDLCVYYRYYYYCMCVYAWTHTHASHTSCSVFQLSTCIWRILYTYSITFWIIHIIISAFSLSLSRAVHTRLHVPRPAISQRPAERYRTCRVAREFRCDDGGEDDNDANAMSLSHQ